MPNLAAISPIPRPFFFPFFPPKFRRNSLKKKENIIRAETPPPQAARKKKAHSFFFAHQTKIESQWMKFGRYEEKEIDEPFYRARANRQKRVRFFFARKIVRNSWRAFQKKMAVSGQSSTQSQRRFQFKVKRKKTSDYQLFINRPFPSPSST